MIKTDSQAVWGMLQDPSLLRVVERLKGRVSASNKEGWKIEVICLISTYSVNALSIELKKIAEIQKLNRNKSR